MTTRIGSLREHVLENRDTVLADLVFAVVWVALVTLLFDLTRGPQWAYHLTLASGIVAHWGFFASLDATSNHGR